MYMYNVTCSEPIVHCDSDKIFKVVVIGSHSLFSGKESKQN